MHMVELEIFDQELFKANVLTSKQIQIIYFEATKRRKCRYEDIYFLLTKEKMDEIDNVNNDSLNVNIDSYETKMVNKAEYLYSTIRNNALYNESEPERLKNSNNFSYLLKK